MKIKTFRDILAWQKTHQLALEIYAVTNNFPRSEQFGLVSQMRRSVISIPSSIAEGFKRKSLKDSLHFYNIAEGSLEESKYQLLLSKDLRYISEEVYKSLMDVAEEVGKLLNGWKKSQR